jgi:hypothetical protein
MNENEFIAQAERIPNSPPKQKREPKALSCCLQI